MTGKRSDARTLDSRDHVLNLFVADRPGAGREHQARQPFRMRGCVVERDESSRGDADEMESPERESSASRGNRLVRRRRSEVPSSRSCR
jgi:hypothetical protein